MSLPARFGGLGLSIPELDAAVEYESAVKVCRPLSEQILSQDPEYVGEVFDCQVALKQEEKSKRRSVVSTQAASLKDSLSPELQRSLSLASEKELLFG